MGSRIQALMGDFAIPSRFANPCAGGPNGYRGVGVGASLSMTSIVSRLPSQPHYHLEGKRSRSMDRALQELVAESIRQTAWQPPDSGGPAAVAASSAEVPQHAEMVPHDGLLAIDELPHHKCCVITHMVTYEKLALPGCGWSVHYDDEGFAIAIPSHGDAVVIEDRMRFGLFKSSGGDMFISATTGYDGQVVNLREFMRRWRLAHLTVCIGATLAQHRFELAVFRWPRPPAARVAISARALYEQLGLDQFGGQQWRWVDGSWRRWRASMQQLGLDEHIMPSGLMKEPLWGS